MKALVFAMAAFALVGAITPGPVNVLAMRHGAGPIRGAALSYVLGASVSYAMVVWLMGTGGERLLGLPHVVETARWLGALYMLYLAWCIATAPSARLSGSTAPVATSVLKTFCEGCATQSLNPKAWLVALAGVSLFVLSQPDAQVALRLFCAVSLLACLLGVGSWALAGSALSRWLNSPTRQQLFNRVMGAVLALCVLVTLQ